MLPEVSLTDFDPEAELDPQLDCSLVAEDEPPVFYCAPPVHPASRQE